MKEKGVKEKNKNVSGSSLEEPQGVTGDKSCWKNVKIL